MTRPNMDHDHKVTSSTGGRSQRQAQRWFTIVWIVLLLTLSGACGGDNPTSAAPANDAHTTAKPDSQPPAPTSATPPTGPSDSAVPVMPEWGNHNSKDGAITFVRHYVDLLNYAQATGDVEPMLAASKKKCASCKSVSESIENLYAVGGTLTGGELSILGPIHIDRHKGRNEWTVLVGIHHKKQTIIEERGSEPIKHGKGQYRVTFKPELTAHGWKMHQWYRTT